MKETIIQLAVELLSKARNAESLFERLVVAVEGINEKLGGKKEPYEKPMAEQVLFPAEEKHYPTEEEIKEGWKELAKWYGFLPRLASAMNNAILDIVRGDDGVTVFFSVVNEAQKEWIECKLIREIESSFRDILGYDGITLGVVVIPPMAEQPEGATEETPAETKAEKSHKRFSHEDENIIRKMYHDGKTDAEIAELLKRTPKSIKNRRFELGLVIHKKRKV